MDDLQKYKALPIFPENIVESMPKLRAGSLYIPGEVMALVHFHLPYVYNFDYLNDNTDAKLDEFLEWMKQFGPEAFYRAFDDTRHRGYKFNPDAVWCRVLRNVYVRDEKLLVTIKLAFG